MSRRIQRLFAFRIAAFATGLLFAAVLAATGASGASAATQQISTGANHTCAVVDYAVKCWGYNSTGQLGDYSTTTRKSPVTVGSKEVTVCDKKGFLGIGCAESHIEYEPQTSSALHGLKATKVTAGKDHTCALASARVYCWGSNANGELGNGSTSMSTQPVAVKTDGVLKNKEVVDVSAGDNFTCAVASDGSLACWGQGASGRLGNNSTNDSKVPVAVSKTGVLAGKKGIKLARTASATMCVLAVDVTASSADGTGYPYCWGYGMGNSSIPSNEVVPCAAAANSWSGGGTTKQFDLYESGTTYFNALVPVDSGGIVTTLSSIDIDETGRATGLNAGKAYYWGLHGYNWVHSTINPKPDIPTYPLTTAKPKAQQTSPTKCKVMSGGSGGNVNASTGKPCGGSGGGSGSPGCGGGGPPYPTYFYDEQYVNSEVGRYKTAGPLYTSSVSAIHPIDGRISGTGGHVVGATTVSNPMYQKAIIASSGNAFDGLFCAAVGGSSAYCDAHTTGSGDGQTGSGFTQSCSWGSCSPAAPSGLQPVTSNGWLVGKTITQISTGASGHTCVIASGAVGCWGPNDKGQLGTGDTKAKSTPTGVSL